MSNFTNEVAATGDEALAAIQKSAAASRRPGETDAQAFTRYLEQNPGTVAELQRQSMLAKRRLTAPDAASVPDPAGETLTRLAKGMVADGKAATQEQAFGRLYESRDPTIRKLVEAVKGRQAALTGGQRDVTDDADETKSSVRTDDDDDPTPGGGVRTSSIDFDSGGDLDPNAGGGGATGGARSCGRAKMFSDIMPAARPVAAARTEGSYNPALRPSSATRAAPSSATSRSYARPDPQAIGKRTVVRKVDEDRLVKRGKRLIDRGFSVSEALYIASAPGKATRRQLAKRIAAQKARAA